MQDKNWIKLSSLNLPARILITLLIITYIMQHISSFLLVMHDVDINMGAATVFENKSLLQMLRLTHQHLMGHGTMYFITSLIFLLTDAGNILKIALVTSVFAGSWGDLTGWWLMKYYGDAWELISQVSAILMACGFFLMSFFILKSTWLKTQS